MGNPFVQVDDTSAVLRLRVQAGPGRTALVGLVAAVLGGNSAGRRGVRPPAR